jgi:hypothetical protein
VFGCDFVPLGLGLEFLVAFDGIGIRRCVIEVMPD